MNSQRLQIYLNDHLAGMVSEVELAERCKGNNSGQEVADFLVQLLADVRIHQMAAKDVLKRLGGQESAIKQGIAWLGEKMGRLKLNDSLTQYSELSRVVELEGLLLAAQLRLALWELLENVLSPDPRFSDVQFATLREQARRHLETVNSYRLAAGREAFVTL